MTGLMSPKGDTDNYGHQRWLALNNQPLLPSDIRGHWRQAGYRCVVHRLQSDSFDDRYDTSFRAKRGSSRVHAVIGVARCSIVAIKCAIEDYAPDATPQCRL
jgi:hypothetical protein